MTREKLFETGFPVLDHAVPGFPDITPVNGLSAVGVSFYQRIPQSLVSLGHRTKDDFKPETYITVAPFCAEGCKLCAAHVEFLAKEIETEETDGLEPLPKDCPAPPPRPPPAPVALAAEEWDVLWETLFGSSPETKPSELMPWIVQSFARHPLPLFGIRQEGPGPCGIIAAVQAFLVMSLFFATPDQFRAPHYMNSYNCDVWNLRNTTNCPRVINHVTAEALAFMLFQVNAGGSDYKVVELRAPEGIVEELLKDFHGNGANAQYEATRTLRMLLEGLDLTGLKDSFGPPDVYTFGTIKEVIRYFSLRDMTLPLTCLSFVLSLILNKGNVPCRRESDLGALTGGDGTTPILATPLIGLHGQTSQELVNLGTLGQAVSQLIDKEVNLGDLVLTGVNPMRPIGVLHAYASEGFVKLGGRSKFPELPIWICSEYSHYRVIYSPYYQMQELNSREKEREKYEKQWVSMDKEENGFIFFQDANEEIEALLDDFRKGGYTKQDLKSLSAIVTKNEGMLTKQDWLSFCAKQWIQQPKAPFYRPSSKTIAFPLYVLDGQFPEVIDRLHGYLVSVPAIHEGEADVKGRHNQHVDETVATVIRSRWPGAALSRIHNPLTLLVDSYLQ